MFNDLDGRVYCGKKVREASQFGSEKYWNYS